MAVLRNPGRERGFTLLEVLVALAVLSVSLAALTRVGSQQARNLEILRSNTYATWVASNVLEEIRLGDDPLRTGRRQGQQTMGLRQWYWEVEVAATEMPEIMRLEVQVFSDPARTDSQLAMTGLAQAR